MARAFLTLILFIFLSSQLSFANPPTESSEKGYTSFTYYTDSIHLFPAKINGHVHTQFYWLSRRIEQSREGIPEERIYLVHFSSQDLLIRRAMLAERKASFGKWMTITAPTWGQPFSYQKDKKIMAETLDVIKRTENGLKNGKIPIMDRPLDVSKVSFSVDEFYHTKMYVGR